MMEGFEVLSHGLNRIEACEKDIKVSMKSNNFIATSKQETSNT